MHGKKHPKTPGKKGQAKHTYGGGVLQAPTRRRLQRALLVAGGGGQHEEREGGWRGVGGGGDGVATEWSAPSADATATPPL